MTDQEKIRRLASAATDSPSSFPSNATSVVIGRPFAIRKPLCPGCHADSLPLPFLPRVAFYQEARVLLGVRKAGMNHRRLRPSQSRPTLATASCCLLCSLGALFVTSPQGEESLVAMAREVIQVGSDTSMMASNVTFDGN